MIVKGVELDAEHDAALLKWMRETDRFDVVALRARLDLLGYNRPGSSIRGSQYEWNVSIDMADRLIQREKKLGNLYSPKRGEWQWIHEYKPTEAEQAWGMHCPHCGSLKT